MPRLVDFSEMKTRHRPNVALGIPATEVVPRVAAQSIMFLCQRMLPGDHLLQIDQTAVVSEARNTLIRSFLELPDNVRFLILIDSDMVVPANMIDLFVSYDLPFVSAYCTRKHYPYLPVPAKFSHTREHLGETVYEYRPITDLPLDNRIHRVDATGAACICVRRDVLEQIEEPWFKFEGGGEDYYFCRKVAATTTHDMPQGVWIAIDTGTQVGHVTDHIAYPSDWFAVKDRWMAESGNQEFVMGEDESLDLVTTD